MRTLIRFSLIVLLLSTQSISFASVNNLSEEDASPSGFPWKLKFPNGSLTDNLDGSYSVAFTPSFGGSSGFLHSNTGTGTVTAMADDQIFVASSATDGSATTIGDCDDSSGNHLNYDTATNAFTCGTTSSASNVSGFVDNGTKIVQATSTDSVIVGPSPTELGKMTISADTDEPLLGIRSHTTQTANVIAVTNSSGTSLMALNGSGNLIIGGTLTVGGLTSNTTFGDGTSATYVISADVSGTDHTITLGSNITTFSGSVVSANKSINFEAQSAKISGGYTTTTPSGLDAATQGAAIDGGDANWRLLFDATTDEAAVWHTVLPATWTSHGSLKIHFSMASATANEVEWEAAIMCVTPGDSADIGTASFAAGSTDGGNTVPGTAGYPDVSSITLTDDSCSAGDDMWIYVSTDANDGTNDDATGDRELLGLEYQYTG